VSEHNDFIDKIPENKPVRIFLPVTDSEERLRLSCVFQKGKTPHFSLVFNQGILPVDRIDKNASVIITVDLAGQIASIEAKILEISNGQTLGMIVLKTISHEQMREFFRVDCTLPILLRSVVPVEFGTEESKWKLTGTTVDLSGSGLRASFTSPPPENKQIRIELSLPTAVPIIVNILASPVRITQLTDKLWDAAYHFDDIDDEDRDNIIGCCLIAQRRLLRLKVKIKNSTGAF
jgi:c-di-GMP-binding flagellar brake protein YcgR